VQKSKFFLLLVFFVDILALLQNSPFRNPTDKKPLKNKADLGQLQKNKAVISST